MRLDQLTEKTGQVLAMYRKKDWESIEELEEYIKSVGGQKIGAGGFSTVYKHPSQGGLVVKISGRGEHTKQDGGDAGWLEWAKYCRLNYRSNRHLLRVAEIQPIGEFFFAAMEPLEFDDQRVASAFSDLAMLRDKGAGFNSDFIDALVYQAAGVKRKPAPFFTPNGDIFPVPSDGAMRMWQSWSAKNKELAAALVSAGKLTGSSIKLDLQSQNFGFRGSDLVIVDPLWDISF